MFSKPEHQLVETKDEENVEQVEARNRAPGVEPSPLLFNFNLVLKPEGVRSVHHTRPESQSLNQ